MRTQKSSVLIAFFCFVTMSVLVFTGCSGSGENKDAADTTTSVAPVVPDTSAMGEDTSILDTADTRLPVKSPN